MGLRSNSSDRTVPSMALQTVSGGLKRGPKHRGNGSGEPDGRVNPFVLLSRSGAVSRREHEVLKP
jgi:hypothetical protein